MATAEIDLEDCHVAGCADDEEDQEDGADRDIWQYCWEASDSSYLRWIGGAHLFEFCL